MPECSRAVVPTEGAPTADGGGGPHHGNSMARAERRAHPVPVTEPRYRIRALHTDSTVTVHQAYPPEIGLPAAREGRFPPAWKRDRMTWIFSAPLAR